MRRKVLFYTYLNNIYSCRKTEKALQENVHFMWFEEKGERFKQATLPDEQS